MGIGGNNAVARPLGRGVTTDAAVCRTHSTVGMTHFGLVFLIHLFNGRSHIAGQEELSIYFVLDCDHDETGEMSGSVSALGHSNF
jgi:hypothetical protein